MHVLVRRVVGFGEVADLMVADPDQFGVILYLPGLPDLDSADNAARIVAGWSRISGRATPRPGAPALLLQVTALRDVEPSCVIGYDDVRIVAVRAEIGAVARTTITTHPAAYAQTEDTAA